MHLDRNKLVLGTSEYWEYREYIDYNMPYNMDMDISHHNPKVDSCKEWMYEHGRGQWTLEVITMETLRLHCSDKQDALMAKLKFGGR